MLDLFAERQVATSVMLRGIASFGLSRIVRSDQSLTLSGDPPVAIAAVDTAAVITALLDDAVIMTPRPAHPGQARLVTDPARTPLPDGDAVKLTVYVGRRRRVDGAPAFYAVSTCCTGTTSTAHRRYSGWTAPPRRAARARFFARNVDVPMMIIAVGSTAQVRAVLPS